MESPSVNLSKLADEIAEREEYADLNDFYEELDELESELDDDFFGYADAAFISKGND